MNRNELCRKAAVTADVTITDAGRVIQAAERIIMDTLRNGESVQLTGFGKFEARTRAAREWVIPPTEKRISVPEAKSPVFKAGKVFRDVLNDRR